MSLKEISELTGVSVSTVGRILRDPKHKCPVEVRKKVLEAARSTGYVPNSAAKSLRSGRSAADKLYSADIFLTRSDSESADPFYDELLMLTEKELRAEGCVIAGVRQFAELSADGSSLDAEKQIDAYFSGKESHTDGLVIIGKCTERSLKLLKKHRKNIVIISREASGLDCDEVICDGKKLAETAVAHLAALGHSKIGYVGSCHNEARFSGYQSAMLRAGLVPDIDHIFDTSPNEQNGILAAEYFIRLSDPPTGIYCANDIIAVGLLRFLQKRRVKLWEPSVISCDDIEQAQFTTPMLTTLALPKEEMAHFAMLLLLDRINGRHKQTSRLELQGTLMVRASCRPLHELTEPEYYI